MEHIIQKYLVLSQYGGYFASFENLYSSHPDYPSLFAATHSLELLSIENMAVKLPKESLIDLPVHFIAGYDGDMVLVSKMNEQIVVETEKGKKSLLSFADFAAKWDGIVLAIEPNAKIEPASHKAGKKWLKPVACIAVFIAFSFIFKHYDLLAYSLLLTSLTGLGIGIFIFRDKLGIKDEFISKMCNLGGQLSCDTVIGSNQGSINKWFGFADLPLLFFSISSFAILINPTGASRLTGILSLISLPIIIYSVYIQAAVIRKWCFLCLVISSLLVIQATTIAFWWEDGAFSSPSLFSYFVVSVIVVLLWSSVKPVIETQRSNTAEMQNLKKFKRSFPLFEFLSKEVQYPDLLRHLEGPEFGNPMATNKLILFISPSCGHCHTAVEDGFEIIGRFPDKVSLKLLFNINPDNEDHPYQEVVKTILAMNLSEKDLLKEAVTDWHIRKIGLEKWLQKWKVETFDMKVNHQVFSQYSWCLQNEFNYTPVKIINDRLVPPEYEIMELQYFLNDFQEEDEVSGTGILTAI
ncbi:MAG TPA: vitamin K epoxide reductase family protein [Flavobacterium sp.]|nr:vitamin K epoxide reductase family protein [Flavobacterium sp.]